MYFFQGFVEEGGMMSYGPGDADLFRRSAGYVDRILKGARPGDLPIEQPVRFDLFVNLKTARTIGVTIPESFLLRADKVIE
jgi:putative ABC transport system substrate-binding protein